MSGRLLLLLWRGQDRAQWLLRGVMLAVVALCTVVLLALAAVPGALDAQARTLGWTFLPEDPSAQAMEGETPDWVSIHTKYMWVDGEKVSVVTTGVAGRGAAEPPGLPGWPDPGTARLSPAVRHLLEDAGLPPDYFGTPASGFERSALRGPDDLLVVQGARPEQVDPLAVPLKRLAVGQLPPGPTGMLHVVLALAGVAVLVPPLLLAWTVLRSTLQSTRRRIATLRLAGLSRGTLRTVTVLDFAVVGLLGSVLGVLAFWLGRPVLSRMPTWEIHPWASDLRPPAWALVVVLIPPLLICAGAAMLVRKVTAAPLSERSRVERPATARELGLAAGAVTIALVVLAWGRWGLLLPAALGGAVVVLLGPSILLLLGRLLSRGNHPAQALAGAQLRSGALRISGQSAPTTLACYVLAVFLMMNPAAVASVQAGVITQGDDTALVRVQAAAEPSVEGLVSELGQVDGVHGVAAVYRGDIQTMRAPLIVWFGSCEDVVAASSLPDDLCATDDVMWASDEARAALDGTGRAVALPHEHTPLPMNVAPDEDQPFGVTVPEGKTGSLSTPGNSWDLPALLVDPDRAGVDLSPFRPTAITIRLDDAALDTVGGVVNAAVPTATITTRATGLWGFAGGLERYYAQLLTGGLGVLIIGAIAAVSAARAQQVESARAHAALHAAGVPARTLRRSVALLMSAPTLVLGLLAMAVGVAVGLSLVTGGPRYVTEALSGLLPVLGGLVVVVLLTFAWVVRTGPPIGPDQLRAD